MTKKHSIIILLLIVALLLSACSNSGTSDIDSTPEQQTEIFSTTTTPPSNTEQSTEPTTTSEASTSTTQTETSTPSETDTATPDPEIQTSEQPNVDMPDEYNSYKAPVEVGFFIELGYYEQDNDLSNGKEPIVWDIIDVQNGKALVISHCVLDYRAYHQPYEEATWEESSLREWLNNSFYQSAFTEEERKIISPTVISTPNNINSNRSGGNDTKDSVFCLSIEEVRKYYSFNFWEDDTQHGYSQDLMALRTFYAASRDTETRWTSDTIAYENWLNDYIEDFEVYSQNYKNYMAVILPDYAFDTGSWWLRTTGIETTRQCRVTFIGGTGYTNKFDMPVTWKCGVRPAMWIDIDEWLNY